MTNWVIKQDTIAALNNAVRMLSGEIARERAAIDSFKLGLSPNDADRNISIRLNTIVQLEKGIDALTVVIRETMPEYAEGGG